MYLNDELAYNKMTEKETIVIVEPKLYSEVQLPFTVYGIMPVSWLGNNLGSHFSLSINHLDGLGRTLSGSSIRFDWSDRKDLDLSRGFKFAFTEGLNPNLLSFIKKTDGRMIIKLTGNKEDQVFYLPLIIKELEPAGGVNPKIVEFHSNIERKILQYEKDLEEYYGKLGEIRDKRQKEFEENIADKSEPHSDVQDDGIAQGMFEIIQYSEDPEIAELGQKYKDAIDWRGPFAGGIAGRWAGYVFQVYSNDHGQHFHVIHRERGINARFSFPNIQLMSYKNSKNTITSKVQENIKAYFQNPENFKKLENEFQKKIN